VARDADAGAACTRYSRIAHSPRHHARYRSPLQREYTTSASEAFSSPLKKKEYRPPEPRSKLRYGMVTPQTLTEAGYSYGEGAPAALKFDPATTSIARMPTVSEAVPMPATTTARAAMAEPVAYTAKAAELAAKGDATLLHSAFAPAAGGAGSLRVDRGKRSLGITGEVLRIGADPKSSTDAQRAWIQYRDPGIHAYRNVSARVGWRPGGVGGQQWQGSWLPHGVLLVRSHTHTPANPTPPPSGSLALCVAAAHDKLVRRVLHVAAHQRRCQ